MQGFHTGEYGAKCVTKSRCRLLVEMERLLYVWISECRVPLSLAEVQFKAQSLHDWVKDPLNPTRLKNLTEKELNPKKPFVASNGWWHRFSKRMDLQSEKLLGEAGSADTKAAEEFPEKFKQMIIGKSIIKFIQSFGE